MADKVHVMSTLVSMTYKMFLLKGQSLGYLKLKYRLNVQERCHAENIAMSYQSKEKL